MMLARRMNALPTVGDLRAEVDHFFNNFFDEVKPLFGSDSIGAPGAWFPALDLVETPDSLTLRAEVPGVDPSKIEVTVEGDVLTIRGDKEVSSEERKGAMLRTERRFGSFMRQLALPVPVDQNGISATFHNGVLQVEMRKDPAVRPKKVPISVSTK